MNTHCVTGFPDVHMNFILDDEDGLGGTLASEVGRPETLEAGPCDE